MTGAPELDELMANAWPAEIVESLDGWQLRWSRGLSRRGNSVFVRATDGEIPELVGRCEQFYRSHDAPSMFLVSSVSAPAGLDRYLDQRGYSATARTLVTRAPAVTVAGTRGGHQGVELTVSGAPSDEWFGLYWSVSRPDGREDQADLCRRVLLRPALEQIFVIARVAGRVSGVGQAVFEGRFAGVQCLATSPDLRGRGVGSAILRELAHQSLRREIPQMYLAVMSENAAARALYDRAGFEVAHDYRYFVRTG